MIRIVIVEDEPIIAKGIQALLTKHRQYHVVGIANDGATGLKLIKELRPDIILSDIEMPQMTGIEMTEGLRQSGIRSEVIFITAFRDFRYAKAALQLGVNNYIVKPIAEAELIEALKKAHTKMTTDTETQKLLLKEAMNRYLLTGKPSSLRHIQSAHIASNWCIFYLQGPIHKHNKKSSMTAIPDTIEYKDPVAYWQQYFHVFQQAIFFNETPEHCFFILEGFYETNWQEEYHHLKYLHDGWQILFSDPFSKIVEAYAHIDRLQQARLESFFIGIPISNKIVRHTSSEESEEIIRDLSRDIKGMIESHSNPRQIIERILHLTQVLGNTYRLDIQRFYQVFQNTLGRILQIIDHAIDQKQSPLIVCDELSTSLDKNKSSTLVLHQWLTLPTFDMLLDAMSFELEEKLLNGFQASQDDLPQDIYILMDYIRQHFRNDLSLTDLAELTDMNRTYVSTYFKRHTGESFKSFQTKLRIEEAKRLLETTDKKVFEIADEIGYIGTHYFNAVFSQYTGVSPTKFRNQVLGKMVEDDSIKE